MSTPDQYLAIIKARHGDRLTSQQLEEIRKGIEAQLDASKQLHTIPLDNGDEPYPPFKHGGKTK
jgi:hypothetical protein